MGRKQEKRSHDATRRRKPRSWCLVYVLRASAGSPPVYVGQTRLCASDRLAFHVRGVAKAITAGRRLSPVQGWIAGLAVLGKSPVIEVIDHNGIWDVSEPVWIDRLSRQGAALLNVRAVVPTAERQIARAA